MWWSAAVDDSPWCQYQYRVTGMRSRFSLCTWQNCAANVWKACNYRIYGFQSDRQGYADGRKYFKGQKDKVVCGWDCAPKGDNLLPILCTLRYNWVIYGAQPRSSTRWSSTQRKRKIKMSPNSQCIMIDHNWEVHSTVFWSFGCIAEDGQWLCPMT